MEFKIKRCCSVCGKIHTGRCKPVYAEQRNSKADKFRNTQLWRRTADLVLERDLHCCRICLLNGVFTNRGLSVHHITPLSENYDLRLDEENLITLCRRHHEQAESGKIPRKKLLELAKTAVDLGG